MRPTDELRDELVPINVTHPLAELEQAVRDYRVATNRRASIEWCLIGEVNDSDLQADRLRTSRSACGHTSTSSR
jgi:23S rRNA (adenine2503-C2)-methyltransferase